MELGGPGVQQRLDHVLISSITDLYHHLQFSLHARDHVTLHHIVTVRVVTSVLNLFTIFGRPLTKKFNFDLVLSLVLPWK